MSQRIPSLFIAPSELHGRGVFTGETIPKGSIIEICPVLVLSPADLLKIKETMLYDYYFEWEEDRSSAALALGFGSIYNHSTTPNARYLVDFDAQNLEIHCMEDIEAGDEIKINYNGSPENKELVWFEKKEGEQKR